MAFTQQTFDVLEQFSINNSKEWFAENKTTYQSAVREPFAEMLKEISAQLLSTDLPYSGGEKTMFRVNRDVRFSSDKSPYNTHVSGLLTPDGTKSEATALLYFHLDEAGLFTVGGLYKPSTERLGELRTAMLEKEPEFRACLDELQSVGLSLDSSDATKTMPRGFNDFADHPLSEYIKLKNLMVRMDLSREEVLSSGLTRQLSEFALSARPLFSFLTRN